MSTQQRRFYLKRSLSTISLLAFSHKRLICFRHVIRYSNLTDQSRLLDIFHALRECGILVSQSDEVVKMNDLPVSFTNMAQPHRSNLFYFMDVLNKVGFQNVADYTEMQKQFVVAMKCSQCRSNWVWNEAEWQMKIHQRLIQTNDETSLSYFDGASMMQYQYTTRLVEDVWCRNESSPLLTHADSKCSTGHGFDPDIFNVPVSSFLVQPSRLAHGGRGVFTTTAITKGSSIMLDDCVHGIVVPSATLTLVIEVQSKMEEKNISDFWDVLYSGYIDGYGWLTNDYVRSIFCTTEKLSNIFVCIQH
jgi:hypothetical protein